LPLAPCPKGVGGSNGRTPQPLHCKQAHAKRRLSFSRGTNSGGTSVSPHASQVIRRWEYA
jgi:hypothetical protein